MFRRLTAAPQYIIGLTMSQPAFSLPYMTVTAPTSKYFAARCKDRPSADALRVASTSAQTAWIAENARRLEFAGTLHEERDTKTVGDFFVWRGNEDDTVESITDAVKNSPLTKAEVYEDIDVRLWKIGIRTEFPFPEKLFMVWCLDKEGKMDLRQQTRPSHLDWVKQGGRKGLVGPFPAEGGAVGSLLLVDGNDKQELGKWLDLDPYNQVDLFDNVGVWCLEKTVENGVAVSNSD